MKVLCVLGRYNYGSIDRGDGYEYANFTSAFRAIGWDVEVFDSLARTQFQNFAELNEALLQTASSFDPDFILLVLMHYEIWSETLDLLRGKTSAVLVHWATDDSWKYKQFSRFLAPHFDIHATTYRGALATSMRDGLNNVVLTQWAASGSTLQDPLAANQCRYPVSFIGTNYGNRGAWISALRKHGIEVACFGHGWPGGAISAEQIPLIIRESVISLNFGDSGIVWDGWSPRRSRQIKARAFEVPGYGGFLLTQPAEDLDQYFEIGGEIALFESPDELARKIKHYLTHPNERDAIALAGHLRVRREHTYEERFRNLVNLAEKLRNERAERGGLIRSIADPHTFDEKARCHRITLPLKLLRWVLLIPCMAIWGRQRGLRAARRILYELSWRFAGAKTYSAAGWPGRLFFRES